MFNLTPEGLELTEVAPGVDLERDILARMDFKPIVRRDPVVMDSRIFRPEPMGLAAIVAANRRPARSARLEGLQRGGAG